VYRSSTKSLFILSLTEDRESRPHQRWEAVAAQPLAIVAREGGGQLLLLDQGVQGVRGGPRQTGNGVD
jgi:hypothetical protein